MILGLKHNSLDGGHFDPPCVPKVIPTRHVTKG